MLQQEIKFSYNGLTLIDFERIPSPTSVEGEGKWLIDKIWANPGTGIIAGTPKTGKTWLMLEMVVAIASGTPFLGRFPALKGPVLVYSPEGSPVEARDRFLQVMRRRGVDESRCPVYFIRKNQLCLADAKDQEAIEMAVMEVQPKLLVFDPLAECFSGDENSSSEVKPVTSFLNRLAREHACSVLLTHHTTKKSATGGQGNAMRGSSALFAFGDSYLFLDKNKDDKVVMRSKQRIGKATLPTTLELTEIGGNVAYEICDEAEPEEKPKEDLGDRILALLREMNQPMSLRSLRKQLGGDIHKYSGFLKELKDDGTIEKTKSGWQLKSEANDAE